MIKTIVWRRVSNNLGKHRVNQSTKDECDMVIEANREIAFVEIENQPLTESFAQGDDIETLRCLIHWFIVCFDDNVIPHIMVESIKLVVSGQHVLITEY